MWTFFLYCPLDSSPPLVVTSNIVFNDIKQLTNHCSIYKVTVAHVDAVVVSNVHIEATILLTSGKRISLEERMTEKIATDNRTTLYTTAVENSLDFNSISLCLVTIGKQKLLLVRVSSEGMWKILFKHSILARKYS